MRRIPLILAAAAAMLPLAGLAQQAQTAAPYKVISTTKVGGDGGFDYVYADVAARKLYIPRLGSAGRITVFDLDTLESAGEIANASAHGVAIDPESHHAFASSDPVTMWDSTTLATIKTIAVDGSPDGITADPFSGRIYVFSHSAPNATVLDAKDGSIAGTIDLGGAPEQAVERWQGPSLCRYRGQGKYRGCGHEDTRGHRPL